MTKLILPLVLIFGFGCANKLGHLNSVKHRQYENTEVSYTLEQLIENNLTAREILNDTADFNGIADHTQKRATKGVSKKNSEMSLSRVVKNLVSQKYADLGNVSYNQILKASNKLSESQFNRTAQDLSESNTCASVNLYFAFAVLLEKQFPEESAFNQSINLYNKVNTCDASEELKARSNYRLSMLQILNNKCELARKHLNIVKAINNKNYISRAEFWSNYCDGSQAIDQSNADDYYKNYPISYHSVLTFKKLNDDLASSVFNNRKTPILMRSLKNQVSNQFLIQAESFIDSPIAAKKYLSYFTDEVLNGLEPEHLIYIGYVASKVKDDLMAFQSLSKAFVRSPDLKTKATIKLYFPLRYFDQIKKYASNESIDPLLVLSLIRQESAFNEKAVSRVGARGLMQIMPQTAKKIDKSLTKNRLFDVNKNISAGTKYLSDLLKRYNNNAVYALAAYNAGFGAVDEWIKRYKTESDIVFMDVIPYQETREYVSAILRNYYWYQQINIEFKDTNTQLGLNQ